MLLRAFICIGGYIFKAIGEYGKKISVRRCRVVDRVPNTDWMFLVEVPFTHRTSLVIVRLHPQNQVACHTDIQSHDVWSLALVKKK